MIDSVLVYLGGALLLLGLSSLIWPMRFPGLRKRATGAMVAAAGISLVIATLSLPAPTSRATIPPTKLDEWMPSWQFSERHVIQVDAPPEKVFAAIRAVRAKDIRFFRLLTAIRRCGRPGPESILNAPDETPLLEVATQTTFRLLADEPPRELVIGTLIAAPSPVRASSKVTPEMFRKALPAGVVLATMNFLVGPDDRGGSIVSSETRVVANDASSAHRFAVYWRIIHPGSAIIRRMWLRAVKLRAEGKSSLPDS